jgi:glucosamine kinase
MVEPNQPSATKLPMAKAKNVLIADCGATKGEWCLLQNGKKKTMLTQGISPYFLTSEQIAQLLAKELMPKLKNATVDEVFYYGTGCSNPANVQLVSKALKTHFAKAKINVSHDIMAAARAGCGKQKGIACILGTGSNSCYFDGKKIVKNNPAPGYVLGDEGSGAYLGKKVLQYYIYKTFDEEMMLAFEHRFNTSYVQILDHVYKQPFPNRYLASFAVFLAENRGHYMIENIIEDGLYDFFQNHIYKYTESWKYPINFVGSVAFGFKDVLRELCHTFELQLGTVIKKPMDGLIRFHQQ